MYCGQSLDSSVLLTYEESTLLLRSAFSLLARFRQKVKIQKFKN
jgi:hypothetical protein